MHLRDVYRRLDDIREAKDDPEKAHRLEYMLWEDVLLAIAEERNQWHPAWLCKKALLSRKIPFPRWYS